MTNLKQAIKGIKYLNDCEKALVARCLISSLEAEQESDSAWAELAEKRYRELISGAVKPVSWEEIKKKMTQVKKIQQEIRKLSPKELAEIRIWFSLFDSNLWDAQIEADAEAGKFDLLASEALEEYEAGMARAI